MSFPGRLAADLEGRLAVSDTDHHRVLWGRVVGRSLQVWTVFGRSDPGFQDGPPERAQFREPQGLALSGDMLIVADRGNHAIRLVDLGSGAVATMAGTGTPALGPLEAGHALGTALCSPWDVLLHDHHLFIAMDDAHQIWRLDLKGGHLAPHAGSGGGPITDDSSDRAAPGQPMGLATDEEVLYFADAGSSSMRRVSFSPGVPVEILVGTGHFDRGDVDGVAEEVRLDHPAALAWGQGNHRLWIADTNNHKLKLLDPASRRVQTLEPFDAELQAPTGIASAGHQLYVADTGHHRILRVDQIDKRVTEIQLEGVA